MTKQEFDILRQHDERLARLEDNVSSIHGEIAALPVLVSDIVCDKLRVAAEATACELKQRNERGDALWNEHSERVGVTKFWVFVGKTLTVMAAVFGAVYGLVSLLT